MRRGVGWLWLVVGRTSSGEDKMKNPTLLPEIFHKGPRFEIEGLLRNRALASGHTACAGVEIHL